MTDTGGTDRATGEPGAVEVTLAVGQNKYLSTAPTAAGPPGEQVMYAVLEVGVGTTGGAPVPPRPPDAGAALAEVLIIDTSRSMLYPDSKLHAAKDATVAAVRRLPDGTAFAVLSGRFDATVVHPGSGTEAMAVAGPDQREAAEHAIRVLDADGGTAIGTWLDLARRLLQEQRAPVKHVLLLTDGRNEHDARAAIRLENALTACAGGRISCDAWGIGDDWDAELLLRITRRLHGRAGAVRQESELTAVYQELIDDLLGTSVPELRIRLIPTPGTRIRQVKQIVPGEQELPATADESGAREAEYVTRGWGDEVRHYQVVLAADPSDRDLGEDLQLAAVELSVPDIGRPVRLPPPRPILVHWTDAPADASRPHPGIRRHQLYQQANAAVLHAHQAWRRGETGRPDADAALARAVALAGELGDAQLLGALRKVADTAGPGAARVRDGLKGVDWQHLILSSAMTTPHRSPAAGPGAEGEGTGDAPAGAEGTGGGTADGAGAGAGGGTLAECPTCHWLGPPGSRFCGGDCGRELGRPPV
ncbi:VWA domain-containing protein [Streptomyces sp. NPDC002514]|uniref:VWA domain-containing protein n=1 Tax=Streptomyces sp. NPDC001270 TaxID=3364554 RepID=UPI00368E5AA5